MESVKQRIARIENLNARGVGIRLQQQQFELACLRELVAVTEKVRSVTEQRDALVVENAVLKAVFNPVDIPEDAVEALTETAIMDHDWDDTGAWSWVENDTDVIRAVLEALKPETPATDAARASLRAEGVEMFAKKCSEKSKQAISSDTRDNWWLCGEHADDFARQLRESKGEVQS